MEDVEKLQVEINLRIGYLHVLRALKPTDSKEALPKALTETEEALDEMKKLTRCKKDC